MKRTVDQMIAEASDKLTRLKTKKRKQEARQKIVLGASILAVSRLNNENAKTVLDLLSQAKMRPSEERDLQPILDELRKTQNEQ